QVALDRRGQGHDPAWVQHGTVDVHHRRGRGDRLADASHAEAHRVVGRGIVRGDSPTLFRVCIRVREHEPALVTHCELRCANVVMLHQRCHVGVEGRVIRLWVDECAEGAAYRMMYDLDMWRLALDRLEVRVFRKNCADTLAAARADASGGNDAQGKEAPTLERI